MKKLGEGKGLVVFPEGTYYKNQMGPGYSGLIRMIHSSINTLFLPVGINYSNDNVKKTVGITYGKPLGTDKYNDSKELLAHAMSEIARLSGISNQ